MKKRIEMFRYIEFWKGNKDIFNGLLDLHQRDVDEFELNISSDDEVFDEKNDELDVVDAMMQMSEDFHGGDENTGSVEDASSMKGEDEEQSEKLDSGVGSEGSIEDSSDFENSINCSSSDGKNGHDDRNNDCKDERNKDNDNNGGVNDSEDGYDDKDNDGDDKSYGVHSEAADKDDANSSNFDFAGDSSENGEYNNNAVFSDEDVVERRLLSRVLSAFKTLLENVGMEVVADLPGSSELDMRMITKRVISKTPIHNCYKDEVFNDVLVLIDNSGSMEHSNALLLAAYEVAAKMQNVLVFFVPNGDLSYDYLADTYNYDEKIAYYCKKQKYRCALDVVKYCNVVVYIGDFDGANTPIELAMDGKEVLWICPELGRYENIEDHSWCNYTMEDMAKLQNLYVYWVDGIKKEELEYIDAFRDALLRKRTVRKKKDRWVDYDDDSGY